MTFEEANIRFSQTHDRLLASISLDFKRFLYDEIEFKSRLIVLKGARGVGKTTLLLQYLKESNKNDAIFLSLDHLYFTTHGLLDTIDLMYASGLRTFVLDEVHRYSDWSMELKNIYDSYPDVHLLVTSSSALEVSKGMADLSRRADTYTLPGLSFREYLELSHGIKTDAFAFDDLLENHIDFTNEVYELWDIPRRFTAFLKHGYYPFFIESTRRYGDRVMNIINQVIDVDLPAIFHIDYKSTRQVKKLLSMLSRITPFEPNISKLSRDMGVHRNRILIYLDFLESAGLLHILKSNRKSDSALTKPDKIYLENPNLSSVLSFNDPASGAMRETFCMQAFSVRHHVSTPIKGDLMIDDKWVVEIGGRNKNFHQISDMPNPLLVKDGIKSGGRGILPMWTLGFLY